MSRTLAVVAAASLIGYYLMNSTGSSGKEVHVLRVLTCSFFATGVKACTIVVMRSGYCGADDAY